MTNDYFMKCAVDKIKDYNKSFFNMSYNGVIIQPR